MGRNIVLAFVFFLSHFSSQALFGQTSAALKENFFQRLDMIEKVTARLSPEGFSLENFIGSGVEVTPSPYTRAYVQSFGVSASNGLWPDHIILEFNTRQYLPLSLPIGFGERLVTQFNAELQRSKEEEDRRLFAYIQNHPLSFSYYWHNTGENQKILGAFPFAVVKEKNFEEVFSSEGSDRPQSHVIPSLTVDEEAELRRRAASEPNLAREVLNILETSPMSSSFYRVSLVSFRFKKQQDDSYYIHDLRVRLNWIDPGGVTEKWFTFDPGRSRVSEALLELSSAAQIESRRILSDREAEGGFSIGVYDVDGMLGGKLSEVFISERILLSGELLDWEPILPSVGAGYFGFSAEQANLLIDDETAQILLKIERITPISE